jgi:hypothetical protein
MVSGEIGGQKVVSLVFSLNFQAFSFILHLLMKQFPFVFYHPLEPVDPCFEDNYEGFLSDLVETAGDRAYEALPVRDIVFGEFSLDRIKRKKSLGARSGLQAGCGIR